MPAELDLVRRLVAADQGLAVVATTRPDGTVHASLVNAGVLDDPGTGRPCVGFVARRDGHGARDVRPTSPWPSPRSTGEATRSRRASFTRTLWRHLPKGSTLPDEVWAQRHRWILVLLWLHVPALFGFSLIRHQTVA